MPALIDQRNAELMNEIRGNGIASLFRKFVCYMRGIAGCAYVCAHQGADGTKAPSFCQFVDAYEIHFFTSERLGTRVDYIISRLTTLSSLGVSSRGCLPVSKNALIAAATAVIAHNTKKPSE